MTKKICILFLLILCSLETYVTSKAWDASISIYDGYINGKSKELVFSKTTRDETYILSRLDWKIDNLLVIGGKGMISVLDDKLKLSINGWNKLVASKSKHVDRDWQNPNNPSELTAISWTCDTELKTAYQIDVEIDHHLFTICQNQLKFNLLIGYRCQKFKWNAYGGTHFDLENGVIINEIILPPGLGISYLQKFSIPYMGLSTTYQWCDHLNIGVFGKYTCFATVKADDFHANRDAYFKDRLYNANIGWPAS